METEQPYIDEIGNEIHEGDLIQVFHFIGARRRKYYMYHIVELQRFPGEEMMYWAGRDWAADKPHYRLKSVAKPVSRQINGTRILDRYNRDERWKK